jgi:hypothetical protein
LANAIRGHLGLSGQHYLDNDNLDHIDQNYQINGKYQATPKVNLSLNTSYIIDTTLLQELLTSVLVIGRSPRTSFLANPRITYNITERLSSTINYNFTISNTIRIETPGKNSDCPGVTIPNRVLKSELSFMHLSQH